MSLNALGSLVKVVVLFFIGLELSIFCCFLLYFIEVYLLTSIHSGSEKFGTSS